MTLGLKMNLKSIYQLTLEDLRRSPVWEHRYEGGREMVYETDLREITDDRRRGYVVLTKFTFPNGANAYGYSSPQDPSGLDYIQPTVIMAHGVWNVFTGDQKPDEPDNTLFPLRYECLVKSDGRFWSDTINADPRGK